MSHPTPPEIQAFASGRLSIQETERIASHLASCDSCCQHLEDTQDDRLIALARAVRTDSLGETVMSPDSNRPESPHTKISSNGSRSPQQMATQTVTGIEDIEIPEELQHHPRYEVTGILGKGGMGVVYRARHRIMERPVALKVISNRFTSNQIAVERFQQEVRAAAKLSHPNIVAAYDAEQAGMLHFLVMEFIEGQSLAQKVAESGPLSIQTAVQMILQACHGLQHAHERQMIHRDIKPQNLMVTPSGQLKLLDFGLARLVSSAEGVSQTAPTAVNLTAVGMTLGTPDFMAPEQAIDATSVDARSDIYSLGCTLYFLLSGQPPAGAGSFSEMLQQGRRRSAVSLNSIRRDIPPALTQILERMMADDPADRFQSAAELAAAAERVIKPESIGATPFTEASVSSKKTSAAPETPTKQLRTTEPQAGRGRPLKTLTAETRRGNRRPEPRKASAANARLPFLSRMIDLLTRHRVISSIVMFALLAPFVLPLMLSTPTIAPSQDDSVATSLTTASRPTDQKSHPATPENTAIRPEVTSSGVAAVGVPRILMLIPVKEFRWSDRAAFDALEEQGIIDFATASWSKSIMRNGPNEPPMSADLLLTEVVADDFDVLIIHGGKHLVELTSPGRLHDDAGRFIRQMYEDGKLITGISAGPGVLASFQLLDGIAATAHPLIHEDVRQRFAVKFSMEPVVRSGQFITARDTASIPEFIRVLQATLKESSGTVSP